MLETCNGRVAGAAPLLHLLLYLQLLPVEAVGLARHSSHVAALLRLCLRLQERGGLLPHSPVSLDLKVSGAQGWML